MEEDKSFGPNIPKPFSPDPSCLRHSGKTNSKIKSVASKCLIRNSGVKAVKLAAYLSRRRKPFEKRGEEKEV
jgi:hypothetical protein